MPVECVYSWCGRPKVSVIIPSYDGSRGGNVPCLIAQLRNQTCKDIEIFVTVGEAPNGRARNLGAERAEGDFLVFLDDDVRLGNESVLENLVMPFSESYSIGLTGVAQLLPPDAGAFQKACARQIPRTVSPVVDTLTDSDMVTTMCLAIPRDLFHRIGEMNDWLLAGVDPELRYRVRRAGYRVVVVPETWAYHPAPASMALMIRYALKKGGYTAWQYRFARDLMYDCPVRHAGEFRAQTILPYRIVRKGGRILKEALLLQPVGLVYDLAYSAGYLRGLMRRWS